MRREVSKFNFSMMRWAFLSMHLSATGTHCVQTDQELKACGSLLRDCWVALVTRTYSLRLWTVNRRNKIAGVLYHRGVLVLIFVPIIDKHRHIQFLYVFCEGSTRQLFFSSVNRFHKQTLAWLPSWQNWKCRWSFGSNRGPRWMMHGT